MVNLNIWEGFEWGNIDWANLVVPQPSAKAVAPAPIAPVVDERTQRAAKAAMTPTTPAPVVSPAPSPTQTTVASPASVKAADEAKSVPAVTPPKGAAESPTLTNTTAVANKFTSASVTATTREERMDELQRTREAGMTSKVMSRAESNPLYDLTERPKGGVTTDNTGTKVIVYYGWIGSRENGQWEPFKAEATPENILKYGARAFGGETKATAGNIKGTGTLKNQPTRTYDKDGNPVFVIGDTALTIDGFQKKNTVSFSDNVKVNNISSDDLYDAKRAAGYGIDAEGNQYQGSGTTEDPFIKNGTPFTGTWQGKSYSNGIIKVSTTADSFVTDTGAPSTSVDVLKSLLRGMGFNSSIIDSSTSFLMSLLKDGLDYDNAVAVFLNSKDYTLKNGNKVESPFYAEYGYLNDGLVKPKTPAELYNAVEGYKEIADKYQLSDKFISKDYLKQYVKNNVTVAQLDERANTARLKAVNADPAYLESLRKLGFLSAAAELTDFFLDPKIGQEKLEQNRATAAFAAEAIRRAGQGITFDAERFGQTAAGLVNLGLSEAQIAVQAAQGFENIATQLAPTVKLEQIYNRNLPVSAGIIQQELEREEFQGLASQRRKQLAEREIRAFQGEAGTGRFSLGSAREGLI